MRKKSKTNHPALNIVPSPLIKYAAGYSPEVDIYLTAFYEKNYTVGLWSIRQGNIVTQNQFIMIDDIERKYAPKATIDNTMAIMCLIAVKNALELGGFRITLLYKEFKMLENVLQGGMPNEGIEIVLLEQLAWAEDNGARFELSNDTTIITEMEHSYRLNSVIS